MNYRVWQHKTTDQVRIVLCERYMAIAMASIQCEWLNFLLKYVFFGG